MDEEVALPSDFEEESASASESSSDEIEKRKGKSRKRGNFSLNSNGSVKKRQKVSSDSNDYLESEVKRTALNLRGAKRINYSDDKFDNFSEKRRSTRNNIVADELMDG